MGIHCRTVLMGLSQARWVVLALWYALHTCSSFNLDGRPGAYAKFPSWEPCMNGSFSFEFKTDSPNALLVYVDHGKFKYFELKMIVGSLRLRLNLADGIVIMRAGEKLNDSRWHKVEVRQDNERTVLTVDNVSHSRTSPGKFSDFIDSSSDREILMFFGGLPQEYENQLLILALPSVVFEPRFRGSIRNLFFRDCGGEPHRPEMIDSFGLRSMDVDLCERGNPCLNGGVCLTTDDGLMCDCSRTEFKGDRCDIEKVPSDATFFGAQYLSYNLSSGGDVLDSNQDRVSLDFRTKQANGLLFYTGNRKDYLNLAIKEGVIVLTINLGTGSYEEVVPKKGSPRLDDNRWHHVLVRREAREIYMEVDGVHRESGSTTGRYTRLSSKLLYVAGSPHTASLPGSRVDSNFRGCMRKVRYKADSVEMDLTELARSHHPLLKINGDVIYDKCQELSESRPITFTTPQSYLTVPTWNNALDTASMAFQFQTVEQDGLLMYSSGVPAGNTDFLALELVDGYINLVLSQGLEETLRVVSRGQPVSDGKPHNVYLEFQANRGYLTVDGQKEVFASRSHLDRLELAGSMYIGGVKKNVEEAALPRELWAGVLGKGYVGCLLDMVMNGEKVDLVTTAQLQGIAGVAEYCQEMEPHCYSRPCLHQGVCVEGWNRFTCDCRATGFIDSVCQTAAATLQFDGTQYVKVTQPEESGTQAEEISLRFRTMHPNGLLFMTNSDHTSDSLELFLENGVLNLRVSVQGNRKLLSVGHTLNDDRWHTVFVKRRGHRVELKIDILRPVTEQLTGREYSLSIKAFFIGYPSISKPQPAEISRRAAQFDFKHVNLGDLPQDDNKPASSRPRGFIGSMQQFMFNDHLFFEMARTGQVENIQLTARLSSEGYVVADPVTFKSMDAYAVLPRLQAHDTFSLSFQLKTTESDGLLLYNAGKGNDFLALELTGGFLYYVYNMGGGTQRIRANVNEKLNDNCWHEIRLLRVETYKQLIRVDDHTPTVDDLSGAGAIYFDLQDYLYLGGVKKMMYHTLPKKIEARHGFMGCIGSLDLNNYQPNVLRDANPVHEAVGDGCQGPTSQCQNDSCANGGRCVQQWTTISCDCDMTSYTGPNCTEESTAYRFESRGGAGLITFSHPTHSRPSTTRENLALGFRTTQESAVLVRIDSASYDDFIEMELVRGKVYVSYNMGTRDYPIGEMFERVNDNKYHIVRFTRSGSNSTIQVDDLMMQTKTPRGQQAHTFNNQAYIYVGGRKLSNGTVIQSFQGTIAGLVLNGIRVLDLNREGDPRTRVEGNVSLVPPRTPPTQPEDRNKLHSKDDISGMQSTMGVGHNLSRTIENPSRQVSMVRYQFTVKLHAVKVRGASSGSAGHQDMGSLPSLRHSAPPAHTAPHRHTHGRKHRHRRHFHVWKKSTDVVKSSNIVRKQEKTYHQDVRNMQETNNFLDVEPERVSYFPEDYVESRVEREIVQVADLEEKLSDIDDSPIVDSRFDASPEVFSAWDDDKGRLYNSGEIFAESSKNEIFTGVTDRDVHSDPSDHETFSKSIVEKEVENSADSKKDFKCTFSSSSGSLVTVDHEMDINDDDEDSGLNMEGSGQWEDSGKEELVNHRHFELLSNTTSSARLALLSGSDEDNDEDKEPRKITTTTVVVPLSLPKGASMASVLHVTVTGDGKLINWDPMTTAVNGVTDDIIYSGASPACPYDDEEDCTEVSSGTDDDIFKPTVIVKTKPAPPSPPTVPTTPKPESKIIPNGADCQGRQCPEHGVMQQTDLSLSTPNPPHPIDQGTVKPTIDTRKTHGADGAGNGGTGRGGGGLNIGLIVGIAVSVLVAVVILCVALYKFRRRDEGTYKVDESQNFTALDGGGGGGGRKTQHHQGNGTLLSHSSDTAKRGGGGGKKKDVKEWYV